MKLEELYTYSNLEEELKAFGTTAHNRKLFGIWFGKVVQRTLRSASHE